MGRCHSLSLLCGEAAIGLQSGCVVCINNPLMVTRGIEHFADITQNCVTINHSNHLRGLPPVSYLLNMWVFMMCGNAYTQCLKITNPTGEDSDDLFLFFLFFFLPNNRISFKSFNSSSSRNECFFVYLPWYVHGFNG